MAEKDKLAAEAHETVYIHIASCNFVQEVKINRANRLITGLSSERTRWQSSIANFREAMEKLPGIFFLSHIAYL